MSRQLRIVSVIGMIAALTIAVLGVFWASSLYSDERFVKEQIAQMRAKGRPVSIADLKAAEVLDSQNAAIIYESIFKRLGRQVGPDGETFGRFVWRETRQKDSSLWSKAKQAAERYRSVTPMIDEATRKPECSFLYTWTGDPFQTLSYPALLRFLNRMVCSMAILDAKVGRVDRALYDVELAFRLSDSLKQDPTTLGQLCRLSMISTSGSTLREVARYGDVKKEALRRLYDTLSAIDLLPGFVAAMEGETAIGIDSYNRFLDSMRAIPVLPDRNRLYRDEAYFLKYMSICVDAAPFPYRELKRRKHVKMPEAPKDPFMSDTLIPLAGGWWKRDSGTAEVNGSQTLLALRAYHSRYGAYPSSLDDLRSKLEWKIPRDPFSGRDFIYRTVGKGFILYSIGRNLKDDGGVPRDGKQASRQSWLSPKAYDIVWQM